MNLVVLDILGTGCKYVKSVQGPGAGNAIANNRFHL